MYLIAAIEEASVDNFALELNELKGINSDFSAAQFKAIYDLTKEKYGNESGDQIAANLLRGTN